MGINRKAILIIFFLRIFLPLAAHGQGGYLEHPISIRVHQRPLSATLEEIGRKGDFNFSYNSNILKGDSLVNLEADHKTVRQILGILLGDNYDYFERGRYIILQPKIATPTTGSFTISGWVVDAGTQQRIGRASIYEAGRLVSTLTDTSGFFRLRLKDKYDEATITVSKELYRDTSLLIKGGRDQEYTLPLERARFAELAPFVVSAKVEKTWLGRLLLSSRQKFQSLNLLDFFASKPIQFSLTPGLGTHGQMGAQVINKFSLNLLGGYTAGSKGLEMAGLFNIDKKDVTWLQAAGLFNMVGGNTQGVQLAGLHNHDLGAAKGIQAAGISNIVSGNTEGVQLAGIYNNDQDSVKGLLAAGLVNRVHHAMSGVQVAGLANTVKGNTHGVQIAGLLNLVQGHAGGVQLAGLGNISGEEINGVQLSTIFNYTKNLKGVQLGLVNIADTSTGYMIGLVNLSKTGYHSLSIEANDLLPINVSYKTGSRKTYSILLAGFDPRADKKAYMLGFGIGTDWPLSKKWSLATDLTLRYFYLGNWKGTPVMYRLQPSLQWRWTRKIGLFAGPAISLYDSNHVLPAASYHSFPGSDGVRLGWTAGINFL